MRLHSANPTKARVFVPVDAKIVGSPCYCLTRYTWADDTGLLAHFADGTTVPSVWPSVQALLDAGKTDYRERVREIPV